MTTATPDHWFLRGDFMGVHSGLFKNGEKVEHVKEVIVKVGANAFTEITVTYTNANVEVLCDVESKSA